jgi:peptide/nickel transport system substrate-binding protein
MKRNNVKKSLVTGVAFVSAFALAACGGSSGGGGGGGGDTSSNGAPTDKVLHLSFLQDPGQPPDPDIYYAGQGLILTTNAYEGLLTYKSGTATPTLEGVLAESWTASKDNKVFTFKLRQGVTFHDGTPFTSAAIKASFDRRAAVNQGPAYMVSDVASVTTQGDFAATITLKSSNSAFLTYLAAPYGPKMMSPTGLAANKGTDNDQTYLTTHDLGSGPYTITQAEVGSKYQMKAYDKYWGAKGYFQTVELPVITDSSSQQLQFNNGQVAAILHDLPTSAVKSYLDNKKFNSYTLPSSISEYLYTNPGGSGFLSKQENRQALLQAIDVDQVVSQAYFGRGKKAEQVYPSNMMAAEFAKQDITHDTEPLKKLIASASSSEKNITIGYDSSQPDNQIVSNLISAQLAPLGLTVKVQSYPTSEIFGWIGDPKGAPDLLATLGWPDSPSPYTWGHISFDPGAGLNYLHCSSPDATKTLAVALASGKDEDYSTAAKQAFETGCWLNMVNVTDFMVAQPWLKGVEAAHDIGAPFSLHIAALSAG